MLVTKDKSYYKKLLSLAIPIALQNLVTYSVGLADNLMIGSLGDSAVSGVYMGNQVQTVLQVISAGIEGAILLLSAQYWGKKDTKNIRKIVSVGLVFSLVLGAFVSIVCALFPSAVIGVFTKETAVIENGTQYLSILAFSYVFFCTTQALIAAMRSVESTRIGLFVSLCSLFIDVFLNWTLIFGKFGFEPMGVRGAAIATLIARICETLIMIVYVRFKDKKLCFRFGMIFAFDKTIAGDFVKYGTPLILGQLVWGTNLAANSMILGRFSESVITATSLANTVNNMMYVCMNGFSSAVGIMTGKTVGSGDLSKIKEYAKTVQVLFLGLGVLTSVFFAVIRDPFISLYSISDQAIEYSRQFINVLRVTCIGTCYQAASLFGLVKSGGDVGFVFKNDAIFIFGVVIPSALISLFLGAPPWVVYVCLKSDQVLKCIVAFFKIRKYNWMKNLTRTE